MMPIGTALDRFRVVAVLGDPYVRRALREGLAARLGRAFEPRRCAELGGTGSLAALQAGGTLFIDASYDWDEASSLSRVATLAALEIELAIVAFAPTSRRLVHDLTLTRRAGIRQVVGVIREGTRTPEAADREAIGQAERMFRTYLSFTGWVPEQVPVLSVAVDQPVATADTVLAAVAGARRGELLRTRGRQCFCCARCGVQLCGAVSELARDAIERDWSPYQGEDESLVPPGRYLRGDGSQTAAGWFELRVGVLYFHQADWLDPDDNGNGLLVTCCGARPDPEKGLNLSCSNGHLLGEFWSDCCSPQGVHVLAENVTTRDAHELD